MYVYMDPPGGIVNIPPGPDLIGHNVLHVAGHHRTEKGPHDIMVNINIVFHSFVTQRGRIPMHVTYIYA